MSSTRIFCFQHFHTKALFTKRTWCVGMRPHSRSRNPSILRCARLERTVIEVSHCETSKHPHKAEKASDFLCHKVRTRPPEMRAYGLVAPARGLSSQEDTLPSPASSSARPNNGLRGGQHGRPRHSPTSSSGGGGATTPSRSPNLPPFPGRNDARSNTVHERVTPQFRLRPTFSCLYRQNGGRCERGRGPATPQPIRTQQRVPRPMRRRPPPVAGAGRSECGEAVVVV